MVNTGFGGGYEGWVKSICINARDTHFEKITLKEGTIEAINEWLYKMHPMDALICRQIFGLQGEKHQPIAKVAANVKVLCNVQFMGIGKIRERISKLRLEFNRTDPKSSAFEVINNIKKLLGR